MKYFFSILLFVFTASCGAGNNEKTATQTYEKAKESLLDKEKKNPLQFLTVHGDDKKNLIGQTVVRGTIINNATVAAYKDVRIKMLCFKDGSMVEEHEDIIDDIVKPSSSRDFKTRYRLPKGTDSIALSIMDASLAAETKSKK